MENYNLEDKKSMKFMVTLFCCLLVVTPFWVVVLYRIFGGE